MARPRSKGYRVRDPYRVRAEVEGVRARSYYKLEAIDAKHDLIKPGQRILDLGAAPGSWVEVALKKSDTRIEVVAVDLQDMAPFSGGHVTCVRADIFSLDPEDLLNAGKSKGRLFDALFSDMAPKTTGVAFADAEASGRLVERAIEFSDALLRPGGAFVAKVFEGANRKPLTNKLAARCDWVRSYRPTSTRKQSKEIFLIGKKKQA